VATSRRALGVFGAQGDFRSQRDDELEASEELLLRGAWRQNPKLEWQAELGAASYRLRSAGVAEDQAGLGDAIARARYLLSRESLPHEPVPLPALSLAGLLRAPLGHLASSGSASFGSGGVQLGLGAWEAGVGLDATRSWDGGRALWLGVEAGYRFADHSTGRSRQLGPRLELAAAGALPVNDWLSAHLALSGRWTANVTRAGQELAGTGERLVTVATSLMARPGQNGIRSSVGFSLEPPVAGLSRNVVSSAALSVSLGYAP
jgi:hypothetical protein